MNIGRSTSDCRDDIPQVGHQRPPQTRSILWREGGTRFPIPDCQAVGWFTSPANYARHFREVHQNVANYFECPLQPDHYRAKRKSDLWRHLGSAQSQLSTGSFSDLTNRCRTRQLPNRSFVDPKGYTFTPLAGRPEVRVTTAEAHADPFCDPPSPQETLQHPPQVLL